MAIEMTMPRVDQDQETGTVVEWLITEGQPVTEGETILVIETDKIAIDVEAPGTGILGGISAHPGDVIPVGTVIAYILAEGEELPKSSSPASVQHHESKEESGGGEKGITATPAARKFAAAHGVDLSHVPATGKGGKVTKSDVEKYQPESGMPAVGPVKREETIPMIGIRRTIADRLTISYQSIPHIQFTGSVDMTKFNKAREDYNDLALEHGDEKISVTALLVKLMAMVLVRHPMVNSSLVDDAIFLHQEINIGVAVALQKGLIIPVVKNADQKTIREIAVEINDLVTRARNNALKNADVKGGTFTISNLGPFGVEQFNAIINPPEAAILAVGATTQEVVAMPEGKIAVRPVMRFTLSADHRIIDGAVAARFVADLKAALENPSLMNY